LKRITKVHYQCRPPLLYRYKNEACATCNDVDAAMITDGECGVAPADPCLDVDCPINSECARTVADCDFEQGLCGWEDGDEGTFMWTVGTGSTGSMVSSTHWFDIWPDALPCQFRIVPGSKGIHPSCMLPRVTFTNAMSGFTGYKIAYL